WTRAKGALDPRGAPLPPGAVGRLGTLRFRHAADVAGFALAPDGKPLASAGGGAIVLWDAETGKELRRFEGRLGGVRSLAFTRDGQFLASGGEDNAIRLWDVHKGKELRRFLGHEGH